MGAAGGVRIADRSEEEKARALKAVQVALELGADVNAVDKYGQTALHSAAFSGAKAVVQLLVNKGARVDVKDQSGETPWSMAAGLGPEPRYRGFYHHHESTAQLLLELGATPLTLDDLKPQVYR